jgi:hypothetical protein
MPFDTAQLDGDFTPMDHREVQPIAAKALKVFNERGDEIPGYHHVVRGDNNETIRVCGESYALVQNEFVVNMIETALRRSKLDLTDARVGFDYSHNGARMFAQWIFPAHTATVRPGVEASLRVVMLNSYDGSVPLSGRAGSYNWVCANQAVAGQDLASFKFRHTGEIDLAPAIAKLTAAAEEHAEQVRRWELWPAIPVSDQMVRAVLTSLPEASTTQVDTLVHAWLKARDEDPLQGGPNLWCLYNVLTAWASKDTKGLPDSAARSWERQKRVATVVEGKLWSELMRAEPAPGPVFQGNGSGTIVVATAHDVAVA